MRRSWQKDLDMEAARATMPTLPIFPEGADVRECDDCGEKFVYKGTPLCTRCYVQHKM